ncbi:hypothetical protein Dtox_0212 [Desulfofarcimen acetoxidans DSM 771]|uniref:Uncharacterized protein n=1 Tax=Desulfofarcimen acetoxidans (strain ATCC 49208 / DSM 771 / KCTC 5769 / VKM B-1644 / 5575) TaxID=485916 RepID=C8W309_DESAS|nr:hypothetical protein Dtox_0212 [Desulfofarcimen acetoxidans DSM 771]
MLFLLSGLASACIAWCINYLLFQLLINKSKAVLAAPVVEELSKTLIAINLGASILYTHLVFGLVEAVWDIRNSHKLGLTAAWMSVGGHAVFGLSAQIIYMNQQKILYSVAAGLIIHLIWNRMIYRLVINNN